MPLSSLNPSEPMFARMKMEQARRPDEIPASWGAQELECGNTGACSTQLPARSMAQGQPWLDCCTNQTRENRASREICVALCARPSGLTAAQTVSNWQRGDTVLSSASISLCGHHLSEAVSMPRK